jgi:hypothetical protein
LWLLLFEVQLGDHVQVQPKSAIGLGCWSTTKELSKAEMEEVAGIRSSEKVQELHD